MRALFVYKNDATRWGEVHSYLPIYQEHERIGSFALEFAYHEGEIPEPSYQPIKTRTFLGYKLKNFILYEEE